MHASVPACNEHTLESGHASVCPTEFSSTAMHDSIFACNKPTLEVGHASVGPTGFFEA